MQILDKFTSSQKNQRKNNLSNSNNINLQYPYIARLLNLNRLKETQDPKNTNGNIGTTLSIGLSNGASKVFTNPLLLMLVIDKLNASPT